MDCGNKIAHTITPMQMQKSALAELTPPPCSSSLGSQLPNLLSKMTKIKSKYVWQHSIRRWRITACSPTRRRSTKRPARRTNGDEIDHDLRWPVMRSFGIYRYSVFQRQ